MLLYRPQAPAHFVARLGEGGWCEGWGWSADGALEDLVSTIECEMPRGVPEAALADRPMLVQWVHRLASEPVLDT